MTANEIRQINKLRLEGWADVLTKQHATPVLLIGVGHDHAGGKFHICTTEDCEDETLLEVLESITTNLKRQLGKR